jgi:hypothetical protein
MSAQPIPEPGRRTTNLKAACLVPLSFFERCLDLEYTQLRCLSLIIAETLGAHPARTFAEVEDQRFVDSFHVSKEWVRNAVNFLESAKLIRASTSPGGVPIYALREEYIQEVKGAGRTKIPGRCPDCKAVGLFSTEFIPTPFLALRKLGGCVDSATFRVTMVVIRHTMRMVAGGKSFKVDPQELNLHDFSRVCDLENREIINGLTEAVRLGIIGREQHKGKASLFWVIPEGIEALGKRPFRVVSPPERDVKEDAKESPSKNEEKPTKPLQTSENESKPYIFGRCEHCGHFVDVEPVSEAEFADSKFEQPIKKPFQQARAGPQRNSVDRNEAAWDVLEQWYGPKSKAKKA